MRFMMFYKPSSLDAEASVFPKPAYLARMNAFIAESGFLLSTDGLKPSSQGARTRLAGERFTVIDGSFAEAEEVIAGYAVLQFTSKEEAIEAAKRFLELAGDGECEIRPLYEASDFGPPPPAGEKAR